MIGICDRHAPAQFAGAGVEEEHLVAAGVTGEQLLAVGAEGEMMRLAQDRHALDLRAALFVEHAQRGVGRVEDQDEPAGGSLAGEEKKDREKEAHFSPVG